MSKNLFLIISLGLLVFSCSSKKVSGDDKLNQCQPRVIKSDSILKDTSFDLNYRDVYSCHVDIKFPEKKPFGNILMLHGWNLPASQWCDSTDFCEMALEKGYALIIPNLSKCNYPLEIYPECYDRYRNYPTLPWVMDTLISEVSHHCQLLSENQRNFVVGLSTGGRGASLISFYMPHLFMGCASISGDFDITKMSDEVIYRGWFGEYDSNKERWVKECFAYNTKDYHVPTYISHGKMDDVSSWIQSRSFVDSLKKNNPGMRVESHFPDTMRHNYIFWRSESARILDFFKSISE